MLKKILLISTLLLSGRIMTLAFIGDVGGGQPGDPPLTWFLPLAGDIVVGLSALWVAYLIARRSGLWVWTVVIAWNAVAIWDTLSALAIHTITPWPEFFMVQIFGSSMFYAATAMHVINILLACQTNVRAELLGAACEPST